MLATNNITEGEGNSPSSYYVSDNLFFLIENDHILVWDYFNHQQFLIDIKYFAELLAISGAQPINDPIKIDELLAAKLIVQKPSSQIEWGWDALSKIFHIGCQSIYSQDESEAQATLAETYLEFCQALNEDQSPALFSNKPGKLVELPEPDIRLLQQHSFFEVLKQRKTSRCFDGKPINLDQLSAILYASFGLIHGEWEELSQHDLHIAGMRKAYPASGGLHSEEAYIVVYRVHGLEPGLYHYRPQDHKLSLLKYGDFEQEVIALNMNQFFSTGLAFGVYISSRFEKIWWKYKHSKAYKVTMLDMGHVSQTFLLTATALNLNTWVTAAFKEDKLSEFLGIDGMKEAPILFVGAGIGSGQAIPQEMLKQLAHE